MTKSHKGAIRKFHQTFIKSGKIDQKFAKIITRIEKNREEADYNFQSEIFQVEAKKVLVDAKAFVKEIEKYLRLNI